MISLLSEYPDNTEVIYNKLPLPNHISTKDLCLLTFPTVLDYDLNVNEICDLIDELEYDHFFHHDDHNILKLCFLKDFVNLLVEDIRKGD
jgi:hypothetical protein